MWKWNTEELAIAVASFQSCIFPQWATTPSNHTWVWSWVGPEAPVETLHYFGEPGHKKACHFQPDYWNACSKGSQAPCKKSGYLWNHHGVGKPNLPLGEAVWPAVTASAIPAQAPFSTVKKPSWTFKPQQIPHEEEQRNLAISQKHSSKLTVPPQPPLGFEPPQLRPQLHQKRDKLSPLCLP